MFANDKVSNQQLRHRQQLFRKCTRSALYDLYQLYNISFFVFLIKGCALTYEIRRHPLLHSVNSQINEPENAATKKLKSQLSYMKPENLKLDSTLYLWHRNQMKKEQWGKRVTVAPVVFNLSDA